MADSGWHDREAAQALETQERRRAGLKVSEASERAARFGPNRLPEVRARHPVLKFLLHYHNVLIYALLDDWVDTGIILAVVVINGLIGFILGPMRRLFRIEPIGAAHWAAIAGVNLLLFLAVEAEKAIGRRWRKPRESDLPAGAV